MADDAAAWRGAPRAVAAVAEIVLALAGDAIVTAPLDLGAPSPADVAALVQRASLGIANFELAVAAPGPAAPGGTVAWWQPPSRMCPVRGPPPAPATSTAAGRERACP